MEKIEVHFGSPLRVVVQEAPSPANGWAVVGLQVEQFTVKGENMSASMGVGTHATVSVEWHDKGGNPVGVEKGTMSWASSDTAVCEVTVATGNPQIANLYAPSKIGKVQIHATGDADLGDGVQTVTATIDVEVIGGQAIAGEITFSQNVAQGPGTTTAPKTAQRR
jgi:hypothetical protein